MSVRIVRLIVLCFMTIAVVAACTSDSDDTAAPTAVPAATATVAPEPTVAPDDTPVPPAPTEPPPPEATATPAPPVPTTAPTSVPDLPGEPWDLFVPASGELLAVVGVAFDDILEVHEAPGENTPLVGNLGPVDTDVVSLGEGRQLPNSIWWRVAQGDVDGWVGSGFMSRFGVTRDITADVVASVGSIPVAETMLDLGMIVADDQKFDDPPSRVVVSVAPTVGDLGEITIDVVGVPDDAVEGERLHIFGQPTESGEGFSLMAVEATVMCRRGVTEDDLCL